MKSLNKEELNKEYWNMVENNEKGNEWKMMDFIVLTMLLLIFISTISFVAWQADMENSSNWKLHAIYKIGEAHGKFNDEIDALAKCDELMQGNAIQCDVYQGR